MPSEGEYTTNYCFRVWEEGLLGKSQGWHIYAYAMSDHSRQFSGLLRNNAVDRHVGEPTDRQSKPGSSQ